MSKKNRSKPALTKSDVIRSMPNASAGAIIKKAKSYGLELTANHVYAVRAIDKRRGRPARLGGGPAVAAPTKSISNPSKSQSKTAFIRGFTRDTPAAKVVEAAKRAGVKITKAYVYRVRALKEPASRPTRAMQAMATGTSSSSQRRDPGAERRLTSLALEIGLLRASVLLEQVRAHLDK